MTEVEKMRSSQLADTHLFYFRHTLYLFTNGKEI